MEQEIDAELAGTAPPPPEKPVRQRVTNDLMSLDEMVRSSASTLWTIMVHWIFSNHITKLHAY